jgi:hypothetical protein
MAEVGTLCLIGGYGRITERRQYPVVIGKIGTATFKQDPVTVKNNSADLFHTLVL